VMRGPQVNAMTMPDEQVMNEFAGGNLTPLR